MTRTVCILLSIMVFVFSMAPAQAKHRHHRHGVHHAHHHIGHHHRHYMHVASYDAGTVVGGRPEGCPSAFCGCGASLYLFGRIIEPLNRAAEWLDRFPRAMASPGMAAARRHHVMVLMEHRGGDVWLVHDSNYGHRTIVHERSISGYVVVNPNQVVSYNSSDDPHPRSYHHRRHHHKKYAGSFLGFLHT